MEYRFHISPVLKYIIKIVTVFRMNDLRHGDTAILSMIIGKGGIPVFSGVTMPRRCQRKKKIRNYFNGMPLKLISSLNNN
jgi:hypothetical protein